MTHADALLAEAEQLLDAREVNRALACFEAAEQAGASPDGCAAGRWMAWMLLGELQRAWQESDGIRERGTPDPHRFWDGEDIGGKRVILRSLHGFGDAVQMLRFVPRLADRSAELILEVPPRLLDLAPCFDGVERVITWGTQAPQAAPAWDVQIEVMELPYLFRTMQKNLPVSTKYLKIPGGVGSRVAANMGPRRGPRVGVVWAAGDWNPSRTLPLEFVERLLRVDGCEFWNLQGGKEQSLWRDLPLAQQHRDAAECGDGILNLAATIEQLDLVITVDTLAAHLAGALGKPAWVLLQYAADWRWMTGRADSPWYPSLRLYRQHAPGDWASCVVDVTRDLMRWVNDETRLDLAG